MARIDLTERRKARQRVPHEVVLNGHTWELPAELPVLVPDYLSQGEFGKAVRVLFGEHTAEAAAELTMDDLADIVTVYGVELGERSASSAS
jgi:hypothetical protein